MRSSVVVISRREQVRRELVRRLGLPAEVAADCGWDLSDVLYPSPLAPRVAIVDVACLFPSPDASLPPPSGTAPLPTTLMVVGLEVDAEALLAAMREGIPIHVLEKVTRDDLPPVADGHGARGGLRVLVGQLCAQRVLTYLRKSSAGSTLTRREAQVIEMVRKGYSNRKIASILGLAPQTVKNHLSHAYEKLGVSGRSEASALNLSTQVGQRAGEDRVPVSVGNVRGR